MDNNYKLEKPLWVMVLVIGMLVWGAVLFLTRGIVLVYVPFAFLIYLFAQSAFIAHLKGNAVRLSESQFPDLYAQFLECCRKLEMEPPEAYVMMSDGVLNALATKFLRRKYVVLYSSIIDALKGRSGALPFYFGHELAHIKHGHLDFGFLKWPGMILPLLGAGYRRAQEYTCDMHGAAVSPSVQDTQAALGVLGSGAEKLAALNMTEFMQQREASGGFWMSFHELTSDYPWLCKRLANATAHHGVDVEPNPRRNVGAWILALFVPRLGIPGFGGAGILFLVAIIGVLAAIAIPAYQDYTIRGQVAQALVPLNLVRDAAEPYLEEHGAYPKDFSQIGLTEDELVSQYGVITPIENGFELTLRGVQTVVVGETIILEAYRAEDGSIGWSCAGGTLALKYRPVKCR
jgi:Zn-dependent protease with chaperone function